MKKTLISLLIIVSLSATLSAAADLFKGPFKAEALAFYFVHNGGPLELSLNVKAEKNARFPKVLACFYRADETLVTWKYRKLKADETIAFHYDYGKNAPKGVYQVRVSGMECVYNVKATPKRSFGVMALRCSLQVSFPDQFAKAYFLVPKQAGKQFNLSHRFGNYTVFAPDGTILYQNKEYNTSSESFETASLKGKVLRLSMKVRKNAPFVFHCTGLPLILCPDAKTAETIGGSLVHSSDGRSFAFPFQSEISGYLGKLTKKELEVKLVPPSAMKKEWEKEPHAVDALEGLFKHLNAIIENQNIDPSSPDFGKTPNFVALAIAAGLDKPFNPYYKNPAMIKRALLGIFKRYLLLNENGTMLDVETNYSGLDCFEAHKMAQTVFFLSPVVSPQERKLLQEGIRRIADRFPFFHVTCENQSSHWLMVYQHLGMADVPGGDYLKLAEDYAASFADPEQTPHFKTGYLQEKYGPDATYQGLAACIQAVYYRYSGNPVTKKLLQTIYHLFNHSVAPEPDGTVYGTSGFSHRTFGTWVQRQWNAGTPMMAGELPEAAVWYRGPKQNSSLDKALKEMERDRYQKLPQWLVYPGELHMSLYGGYFFPATPLKNALFPMEVPGNFIKNFNQEFLAVKENGYYAFAYTGMTSAKWMRPTTCRKPGDRDHRSSWNPIQGIQLIWSKEYGSLFTTTSWNSYTYAMTIADLSDHLVSFPDYWTFQHKFDAGNNTLVLSNKMFDLPAEVTRTIHFGKKEIHQKLLIRSTAPWKCRGFYEQLPLVDKKDMRLEYLVNEKWSQTPGIVSAVRVTNGKGAGFLITLKKASAVVLGKEQEKREQKLLPLRFVLGNSFAAGQNILFEYTIRPIQ